MPDAAREPLLVVEGLSAGYGKQSALEDVDLEIRRGAVTALVGQNGSGKTTMLRVLLGLIAPGAGTVRAPGGRPRFGYVPQADISEPIFPVTALEVVVMGLTPELGLFRRAGAAERERAREALAQFDVGDLAERPFREMSGGQRQRVSLARAVVGNPELLALDEPVRGLDFASSATLVAHLSALAHERQIAVVVATHSLDLVANYADELVLFRDRRCVAGPVSELFTDEHLSRFQGTPVCVREVEGVRVVLPGEVLERSARPAGERDA